MLNRTLPLVCGALVSMLLLPADVRAETKPAVVWIPTSPVDVTPSGSVDTVCAKTGMSGSAVAAGCLPSVDEDTTLMPHPDAQTIVDGVTAAFAAYDIRVVTEAPPEYLPTFAVFTSDAPVEDATSYTCSSPNANCAARSRDRAHFTNGGTDSCTDPDIVTSAVFTLGLLAGLEGKDAAPDDWMNYPPNFIGPPTMFVDGCGAIANPIGGEDGMTVLPLECTSLDHVGCDAAEQNSHADLLENLGVANADEDAPVIDLSSPTDGDVIEEGGALEVTFTLDEASNFAGVRIVVRSEALVDVPGVTAGELTFCTTDLCDLNFLAGDPFKTADSTWSTGELVGLPSGEYTVEIEASDYYGNEAEMISLLVTVGDGPVDPTEGDPTTGGETSATGGETSEGGGETGPGGETTGGSSGPGSTTGPGGDPTAGGDDPGATASASGELPTTEGGESSGGASADDSVARGCSAAPERSGGASIALMFGLLGLRLRRRAR